MENDLLSIIIPVYNTAKYLDRCLESVLKQTYKSLEIICVDDGSTDASSEILEKYIASYPNIFVFHHEKNKGLLEARRTGIYKSNGKFIQFVDSDDTIDPKLCESAVRLIKKHNTDIVEFSAQQIDVDSKRMAAINPFCKRVENENILTEYFVTRQATTWLLNKIFRSDLCKRAFENIPPIHCYAGEDILVSFFLAYYSSAYIGISTKSMYNYFLGLGISSTRNITLEKYQQYCKMNVIPAIIKKFIEKEQSGPTAQKACEYLTRRLVNDCCVYYLRVGSQDKDKALRMFNDYWNNDENFSKTLLEVVTDQKKIIDDIYRSESYKIGNFIVSPVYTAVSYIKRGLK